MYPDARNRWAHPELADEGLEPHTVDEIWLIGRRTRADHYSRHHRRAIDRKIEALLSHKSQMPDPARPNAWCGSGPWRTRRRPGSPRAVSPKSCASSILADTQGRLEAIGGQMHPLDMLTGAEIERAVEIVRADGRLPEGALFAHVVLHEPAKADLAQWKAGDPVDREVRVLAVPGPALDASRSSCR